MIGQVSRRILRRVIRGLVRARLAVVVVLGLVLVAAAVGAFQSLQSPGPGPGISLPSFKRAPESTENYLKGNQTYNAELMIASLSTEAVDRGSLRGAIQEYQQQLEASRQRGIGIDQYDYVAGHSLPDGTSLQFYVVAMRGLTARAEVEYVTYIFTLDRTGKIQRIQ